MASKQDELIIAPDRSTDGISVLFILLALGFAAAITTLSVYRWRSHGIDPSEAAAAVVVCLVVGRHAYCRIHRMTHERTITLRISKGHIVLNDEQLDLTDAEYVFIVSVSPYRGGSSYHAGIRDRSGHTRMLAWFTGPEAAEGSAVFFTSRGIPVKREESSWSYRLQDISWGSGLWHKARSRA